MDNKKTNISDVAKLAKVGKTSVSRYLNGEFNVLSDEIRDKISSAIKALNYQPSQIARSMRKGKTKLIALIFADINNPYSIDIMQGIESASWEYGYTLLVFNTNNELEQEKRILQSLLSYQVEGVIIQALRTHDKNFKHFSLPIVSVDRVIHQVNCDVVSLDNEQATILVVNHLLQSEFKAILFITGTIKDIQPREKRIEVFKRVMSEHQDCYAEVIELNDIKNNEILEQAINAFYKRYRHIKKAIISINGITTLNIVLALRHLQLEWGKDIGLIGFDELVWAPVVGVGITTLQQPTQKMGYSACKLFIERINGDLSARKTLLYPGRLIVRESTG